MKKKISILFLSGISLLAAFSQTPSKLEAPKSTNKAPVVAPSYAWKYLPPLGQREEATIDTLYQDYSLRFVPATQSPAWVTTGNYGAPAENLIYFQRPIASDFYFRDAIAHWVPSTERIKFYNTRIPMTLVGYSFGGGKEVGQDVLSVDFSGNANARTQVGVMLDYLYSKGSYNYQAMKDLTWGFSGSYTGDRYQFQGFFYHFNLLNKENGGITDDLYITNPAEIQGGSTSVNYKTIPTRLSASHNRNVGARLLLNNKYSLGFYKDVETEDSIISEFVPVTSFTWTLDYTSARHTFRNTNAAQDADFWSTRFLSTDGTNDKSSYWSLRNTLGVSLLEGFNKYAKAGLSVFLTHEFRSYTQPLDTLDRSIPLPDGLTELPFSPFRQKANQNLLYVGAQLIRSQGKILNYSATGELGLVGESAGEVKLNGDVYTHIPMFGDTVSIAAYGHFSNLSVPYLLKHYISNHFAWNNDFGKTRRLRLGGELQIPWTKTILNVGIENVQNLVYFNKDAMPTQAGSSVQIFSAALSQNFRYRGLGWENRLIYQTSSADEIVPLPKLSLNSNLYVTFRIARVFHVQVGVDCTYYTRYHALNYQPATMAFYNQREVKLGNYPYMNAYVNMKLSKTRFFVMMSHVNQGLFGSNDFFSMPHYPLNPRRLHMGLSVDFAN